MRTPWPAGTCCWGSLLEVQGEAAGTKIHHPEVSLARFPRRSWRHGESAAAPRLPKLRQAPGVSQRETGGDGCPSPDAIIKLAVALNTDWGCGGRVARRLQKPWVTYFVDGPYLHVARFFLIATLLPPLSCLHHGVPRWLVPHPPSETQPKTSIPCLVPRYPGDAGCCFGNQDREVHPQISGNPTGLSFLQKWRSPRNSRIILADNMGPF